MEHRLIASQNACTKNSRLTGLCSGVCVAELAVPAIDARIDPLNRSSSSGKKPTAIVNKVQLQSNERKKNRAFICPFNSRADRKCEQFSPRI